MLYLWERTIWSCRIFVEWKDKAIPWQKCRVP